MSVVFNLGGGNWAGRYSKMLAYKVDNGNYIANELNFTRTTTGTFVNQNGLIEEQEIRVPRVDYLNNSNGTLLVEPQRTNLALGSENLSLTYWHTSAGSSMVNDTTISPDGTQNASTLTFGSSQGSQYEDYFAGSYGNQTHIVSCYVKVATGTAKFRLKCTHWGVADFYSDDYTATDEWQRFTFSKTFTASGGTGIIAGLKNETAGGSKDILVYGFQVEANASFPTSYIPTNGTSVTRANDYFNGYFDEVTTQGTIFIDFEQLKQGGGDYRFRNPSNQNSYAFYYYGGGIDVYNGAAFIVDRSTLEPNNSKVAVSWNGTSVKVFINGNNRTKSNAVASIRTTSQVIFTDSNDIANLNEIKVYAKQLTDEELINLTT